MTATYAPAERGKGLARLAIAIGLAKGDLPSAHGFSAANYGELAVPTVFLRDAVSAGSTTNVTWAAPLAGGSLSDDFIPFARPRSAREQLVLREADIGTRVPIEIENAMAVSWVGEGAAKPLSSAAFDVTELLPYKLTGMCVLTQELLRSSNAEVAVRIILAGLLARMQDTAFFSADAVTPTSPGGILAGITPTAATGDPVADIAGLIENFEGDLSTSFFVMHPSVAAALSLRQPLFDLGVKGGTLSGVPVITTRYVPSDSTGSAIVLLDGQEVLFASGPIEIASATSASVQLADDPTNSSTTPTATQKSEALCRRA